MPSSNAKNSQESLDIKLTRYIKAIKNEQERLQEVAPTTTVDSIYIDPRITYSQMIKICEEYQKILRYLQSAWLFRKLFPNSTTQQMLKRLELLNIEDEKFVVEFLNIVRDQDFTQKLAALEKSAKYKYIACSALVYTLIAVALTCAALAIVFTNINLLMTFEISIIIATLPLFISTNYKISMNNYKRDSKIFGVCGDTLIDSEEITYTAKAEKLAADDDDGLEEKQSDSQPQTNITKLSNTQSVSAIFGLFTDTNQASNRLASSVVAEYRNLSIAAV